MPLLSFEAAIRQCAAVSFGYKPVHLWKHLSLESLCFLAAVLKGVICAQSCMTSLPSIWVALLAPSGCATSASLA